MSHAHSSTEKQQSTTAHEALGEKLEIQIWDDMKHVNLKALEHKLSPEFQSIHADGSRNKSKELELIKNLHLGNYTFSNMKVTQQGDAILVTYMISVEETIDGRPLSHKAHPRLSVWKKNANNEWQWFAHANLNPLGKK